jgi:tetratricopeptide (TPR) repeat protein
MSQLKNHPVEAVDSAIRDSDIRDKDRSDGGAGVALVIIVSALVLLLLIGGSIAGVVLFVGYQRQLQEEQLRLRAMAEMERAQALLAAQQAEEAKAQAELAVATARAAAGNAPAAAPQPAGPTPEELFQGEIEPLNQAVAEHPDDPKVWQDRARALQRWQKWREAAEDYERFLEANPYNSWTRMDAAVSCLASGNVEGYLEHCRKVEEHLATKSQSVKEHNRAARVLSLRSGALISGDLFLDLARQQSFKEPDKWWTLEPVLALQYRLGRLDEAAQTIDKLRPLATFSGQKAATEIWAAMTYHQLGRQEEARQALAAAEQVITGGLPAPGTNNAGGDAVVIAQVVIDEARALIEGQAPTANNGENEK